MKKLHYILIGTLVVGVMCFFLAIYKTGGEAHAHQAPRPSRSAVAAKEPIILEDKRLEELVAGKHTENFYIDSAKQYLSIVGENSKSLTVAYFLTFDATYLEKLKTCAGDSMVAISTFALALEDPTERISYSKVLIEKDPTNKIGYLMAANTLISQGDFNQAVIYLENSKTKSSINQFDKEKMLDQREAWQILGCDPLTARIRVENRNTASNWFQSEFSHALRKMWKEKTKNSDVESRLKSAENYFSAAFAIRDSSQIATGNGGMVAGAVIQTILKDLPSDYEYGETGRTLKQEMDDLFQDMKRHVASYPEVLKRLRYAPSHKVDGYYQRIDALGAKAAEAWFLSETE